MTLTSVYRWASGPLLLAASLVAAGACDLHLSNQAEAKDQWKRSYTLAAGGTLEVRNSNGRITVEAGDGNGVEVVADRLVRAASDEAAKDALAKFEIAETVAPDRVKLDSTNRGGGIFVGMSRQVDYQIRVPRWANVTLDAANSDITVTGLSGDLRAETTNGRVRASALSNGATIVSTNGAISLDMAAIGRSDVSCETTNGLIAVTVPRDGKALLSVRVLNGTIKTENLDVAVSERSRQRLDGTIGGGGGPKIRLETTNGLITLTGR